MIISKESIQQNVIEILQNIASAAAKANRPADSVKLMAVTKTKPWETIQALIDCGIRCFGENYPEEIEEKASAFSSLSLFPAMIGHLQSRKCRIVADNCSAWHSLDRLETARKMELLCSERERILPVFIECNLGGEESKSGWSFNGELLPKDFLTDLETLQSFPHLDIQGLMILPPFAENGEDNRAYFARTRQIADILNEHYGTHIRELSMGTSSDYLTAIEEGSTIVRIGTALVGAREYKNR